MRQAWYWVCDNFWWWPCPFCEKKVIPYWHKCGVLEKLSTDEKVRRVTTQVRAILDDEPADKLVHSVRDSMDKLDATFSPERKK